MATHSSVLAWRILWTEEPGGLLAVHGVAQSRTWLSDLAAAAAAAAAVAFLLSACKLPSSHSVF